MEKIKCPECGQVNEFANDSCINCGFPFDEIKEEEFERQIKKAEEEAEKAERDAALAEERAKEAELKILEKQKEAERERKRQQNKKRLEEVDRKINEAKKRSENATKKIEEANHRIIELENENIHLKEDFSLKNTEYFQEINESETVNDSSAHIEEENAKRDRIKQMLYTFRNIDEKKKTFLLRKKKIFSLLGVTVILLFSIALFFTQIEKYPVSEKTLELHLTESKMDKLFEKDNVYLYEDSFQIKDYKKIYGIPTIKRISFDIDSNEITGVSRGMSFSIKNRGEAYWGIPGEIECKSLKEFTNQVKRIDKTVDKLMNRAIEQYGMEYETEQVANAYNSKEHSEVVYLEDSYPFELGNVTYRWKVKDNYYYVISVTKADYGKLTEELEGKNCYFYSFSFAYYEY